MENKKTLYRSLKAGGGVAEKTTGHIVHEVAKGKIQIIDGKKIDTAVIWILHAIAWKYCQLAWIRKFLETKVLPPLNEVGMKTLQQINEESDKFIQKGGYKDEDLVINIYGDEKIFRNIKLHELITYCPYVFITDSEIKKYLGRSDIKNSDIYQMVNKTTDLILKGNPFIWAREPDEKSDRLWERISYKDVISGLLCFPDDDFLEPIAPKGTPKGRKRIVNGKKEDTTDHLYVFVFRGHSWGIAFLKSCIFRRVNMIDRKVYQSRREAQILYFVTLWIDDRIEKRFYFSTQEICKLLDWKYPPSNKTKLRHQIERLLTYMQNEGMLQRDWKRLGDMWFVMPAKKLKR
jgi:hypothetical protein